MSDDYAHLVEVLQQKSVSRLKAAAGRPNLLREAIRLYLEEVYNLDLSASELIDYFAVSTPNIIEDSGHSGAAGDALVAMFDQIHEEFRRSGH